MASSNLPIVLTISRQFGSGGARLGQRLARQLGLAYMDRQIIAGAAKKLHLLESEVEFRDERKSFSPLPDSEICHRKAL